MIIKESVLRNIIEESILEALEEKAHAEGRSIQDIADQINRIMRNYPTGARRELAQMIAGEAMGNIKNTPKYYNTWKSWYDDFDSKAFEKLRGELRTEKHPRDVYASPWKWEKRNGIDRRVPEDPQKQKIQNTYARKTALTQSQANVEKQDREERERVDRLSKLKDN